MYVVQCRHLIPSPTGSQPLALAFQPSNTAAGPVLSIVSSKGWDRGGGGGEGTGGRADPIGFMVKPYYKGHLESRHLSNEGIVCCPLPSMATLGYVNALSHL